MIPANHAGTAFRFCPACGAQRPALEAGPSIRCNACDFRFFINACGAVAGLIVDRAGRLLLTRRAHDPVKGTLDLPGGFVDLDESAEDALRREIKEELNLDLAAMIYLTSRPNQYRFGKVLYHTLDLAYICTPATLEPLRAADDVAAVEWHDPARLDLAGIGLPSIRAIVEAYRRQ